MGSWWRGLLLGGLLALSLPQPALAGKLVGEDATYSRKQGFVQQLFYVSSGNGEGQVEYICKCFVGVNGCGDTSDNVWQVQRLQYDASNRVNDISFAGGDDAFNQVCDDRTSLTYK